MLFAFCLNVGELLPNVGRRERGAHMIRTVWLGLFLLFGIGALASFKFAFSSQQPISSAKAATFVSAYAEPSLVATAVASDTLTKSDRLQVMYVAPTINVNPAASEYAAVPPPVGSTPIAPKIITRHWHDPHDQKLTQLAKQKAKVRDSKKSAPVVERKPSVEANSCNPDGLEGLRQLFNSPSNCVKTN